MASQQEFPVVPPLPHDREALLDFSEVIQRNLRNLFEASHNHTMRNTEPVAKELEVGVPVVVNLNGIYYIYVKINNTQIARVALTVI